MSFSFSTALSGLRASSNSLGVTGNNIANANTTGFKSGSLSFADIFLSNGSSILQVGNGVRTVRTNTNFGQGGLTESGSPTSTAIQGTGFFVVVDPSGVQAFTRAGDFSLDRNGFLITPGGQRVQGYVATGGQITPGTPLSAVRLPIGEIVAPQVTTSATLRLNLNSADSVGAIFSAPVQVFDTKGVAHTLELRFTKQADGSYLMNAMLDQQAAQTSANGGAPSGAPVSVTFDANGLPTSPTALSIIPDQTQLGGGALPAITINLRQTNPDGTPGALNITNYAITSAVTAVAQDGFPSGSLISFSTDRSGTLFASFSNGQSRPIAQLALAIFNAQTELRHLSGNLYGETLASGQPSIGAAGSGGRGEIVGGAIEQSNVDIANEFTELIVAQRGFQANSRVITTLNQTLQDLIQII